MLSQLALFAVLNVYPPSSSLSLSQAFCNVNAVLPLPSPSLLPATLVAATIPLTARALALFIAVAIPLAALAPAPFIAIIIPLAAFVLVLFVTVAITHTAIAIALFITDAVPLATFTLFVDVSIALVTFAITLLVAHHPSHCCHRLCCPCHCPLCQCPYLSLPLPSSSSLPLPILTTHDTHLTSQTKLSSDSNAALNNG
jgi:hypothetical protein